MKVLGRGAIALLALGLASAAQVWTRGKHESRGELTGTRVGGVSGQEEALCDSTVASKSGYYKISGSKSANYFYWFFESRNDPTNDPVIIWLTGGPGCSSILALFAENGPCSVNSDGTGTVNNPFSWNSRANIMWIDQPAGVGFSYGDPSDYASNEAEVSEDLYQFLQAFFEDNPRFQKNPFYVFGESYGGHYAPATAHRVFIGNVKKQGLHINLKGVGVGNGLTDPEIQYQYYGQMAVNNTYGVKAVDDDTYLKMEQAVPRCVSLIQKCQKNDAACAPAQTYCNVELTSPYAKSELNVYDIRQKCANPPLCYDFSGIDKFLGNADVQKALNVDPEGSSWQECNMEVNSAFKKDWMKNYQQMLPPLLEAGIQVLIYAGDCDYICNWMGNKAWTLDLDWRGKADFNKADDKPWTVNGVEKGKVRSSGGFTFLQVYEAGHMVPMDQPEASLAMLDSFIAQEPLVITATL